MDPAALIPSPDPLQVPWGWFEFLLQLTFLLHLVAMNVMVGLAFIGFVRELTGRTDPAHRQAGQVLTHAIALAVNFGVAPLLFLQVLYGHLMYTSSILMGGYWLLVVFLLIFAYGSAYGYKFLFDTLGTSRRLLLATSLSLLLLIGFLFTNNMTLMLTPERWTRYFTGGGRPFLNLGEPTLLIRYLHFMVAGVATGGLTLAMLARFRRDLPDDVRKREERSGLMWFTYATMVEIAVGILFLFTMPREIYLLFVGGKPLPTLVFLASMVAVFMTIRYGIKEQLYHAAGSLAVTMLLMILVRDLARKAYLAPFFKIEDLPTAYQYSPMVMFFLVLAAGLGIIGYMLRLAWQTRQEVE